MRDQFINSAVITVDWSRAAIQDYRQSAADTVVIGREARITAERIHIIGKDTLT